MPDETEKDIEFEELKNGTQNKLMNGTIRFENNGYTLVIPEEIIFKIPDEIKNDTGILDAHLIQAIKCGLIAMEGSGFTLSTDRIEAAIQKTITAALEQEKRTKKNFEALVEQKLTGEDAVLMQKLDAIFNGDFRNMLIGMLDEASNPNQVNSIPNRVVAVMDEKFNGIETEITAALDLGNEDSQMSNFLTRIQTMITNLVTEMANIKIALNVDEKLQAKDEKIADLEDKSSGKGIHFENDVVETLTQYVAASQWGDEILHTGGNVVDGSLVKAGDVIIKINSPGNLTIAVEVKSGKRMSMAEISRETKRGREARSADAGIGVMTRRARGTRQNMLSNVNAGNDTIVVVEWAPGEDNGDDLKDWVALEVAYTTIRAKLIAEHLGATKTIDTDAINNQVSQIETDLSDFAQLKTRITNAISSVEAIEEWRLKLFSKLKDSLDALKDLTDLDDEGDDEEGDEE